MAWLTSSATIRRWAGSRSWLSGWSGVEGVVDVDVVVEGGVRMKRPMACWRPRRNSGLVGAKGARSWLANSRARSVFSFVGLER